MGGTWSLEKVMSPRRAAAGRASSAPSSAVRTCSQKSLPPVASTRARTKGSTCCVRCCTCEERVSVYNSCMTLHRVSCMPLALAARSMRTAAPPAGAAVVVRLPPRCLAAAPGTGTAGLRWHTCMQLLQCSHASIHVYQCALQRASYLRLSRVVSSLAWPHRAHAQAVASNWHRKLTYAKHFLQRPTCWLLTGSGGDWRGNRSGTGARGCTKAAHGMLALSLRSPAGAYVSCSLLTWSRGHWKHNSCCT